MHSHQRPESLEFFFFSICQCFCGATKIYSGRPFAHQRAPNPPLPHTLLCGNTNTTLENSLCLVVAHITYTVGSFDGFTGSEAKNRDHLICLYIRPTDSVLYRKRHSLNALDDEKKRVRPDKIKWLWYMNSSIGWRLQCSALPYYSHNANTQCKSGRQTSKNELEKKRN